jgi:hypothetical protein
MPEKLSKDELVVLVGKIQRGEGSEAEITAMLEVLADSVPDPDVADLVYCEGMSAEEVVELAFKYKPISLE